MLVELSPHGRKPQEWWERSLPRSQPHTDCALSLFQAVWSSLYDMGKVMHACSL